MAECSESRSVATPNLLGSTLQSLQRCGGDTKVNIGHVKINQPDDHHLTSNNELMLSIKKALKDRYRRKDACMLSLLLDDKGLDYPLEGCCFDLIGEKDLMGTFSEDNVISLDKIFISEDEYGRRRTRQLLITGDSGYGKTTLAKKLSYDWATLDPGSYISHFDMLVNIPLIATGDQSLKESIRNALDIDQQINRIIIDMKLRWLIILDGLYEASDPCLVVSFLKDCKDSIQGDYPNSTIILTSKTKYVNSSFDRRLCILGLSKENQKKYIKAVFSPNTDKEMAMVKEIENDAFLQKASECPLLLHMMCCVYGIEYDKGTSRTTSTTFRTKLYLQIFNLLRVRYLKKHGKTGIVEANNILDDNIFIKLGKVAQSYLRSRNLITEEVLRKEFLKEEEYKVVLRLGILLGLPIRIKMRVILKYVFIHRTFAEFLEAIYILYLTKQPSQDFSQVLWSCDNLGTATFVAGLMGKKFVEHESIFLWISGDRTLSELAEIKNEADLDHESWERVGSLNDTIRYHDSSIERNLVLSSYTLSNLRWIAIETKTVNRDFWKCVNQIIQEPNFRADVSIDFPVSVAELTSFKYPAKVHIINMENTMSELIHISNLLSEKRNFCTVGVYIDPAKFIPRKEEKDSKTARNVFWEASDLRVKPLRLASHTELLNSGRIWRFLQIEIFYCKQTCRLEYKELASIIPILVMTEAHYSTIIKESALDQNKLKLVDFKDVSMCRTFDDLTTTLRLGEAQNIDVVERLFPMQVDLFHIHDYIYDLPFVTLLKSH